MRRLDARASRNARRRSTVAALCALALCALAAGPAQADFVPTTAPCAANAAIAGFAASGATWLTLCVAQPRTDDALATALRRSSDHGATWTDVVWTPALGAPRSAGITTGPDGAFYLGTVLTGTPEGQAGRILRVDPATGAMSTLPGVVPVPGTTGSARMGAPAFDASGRMWIAYNNGQQSSGTMTLARRGDDGSWTAVAPPVPAGLQGNPQVLLTAHGTFLRAGTVGGLDGALDYRLDGSALTKVGWTPSFEDGDLVLTEDFFANGGGAFSGGAMSIDGGASWMLGVATGHAVEGDPALLVTGSFAESSRLVRRFGPTVFAGTGIAVPFRAGFGSHTRVVRVDGGYVAVSDESADAYISAAPADHVLAFHAGAVGDLPATLGPLSPTFSAWLDRANHFRALAGVPPLVGDPAIAQAAENHSRYWTLNPYPAQTLDLHRETPGTPGFTGERFDARCAAAGTTCLGGEIMAGGPAPVDLWVATTYHRFGILGVGNLRAGGGAVDGGPAVMDVDGRGGGLSVGPLVFPRGAYDGPLSFGGEAPDPGAACAAAGQPISQPYGTDVSVRTPGGTVSAITVTPQGGAPLAGCQLSGDFLPAKPLAPFTTYDASAVWKPNDQMAPRTIAWQFTTSADADVSGAGGDGAPAARRRPSTKVKAKSCRPSLRLSTPTVRRRHRLTLIYAGCGRGRLTITLLRLHPRSAAQRRPLMRRVLTLTSARKGSVHLSTARRALGRYRLTAALTGTARATLSTTVRVR